MGFTINNKLSFLDIFQFPSSLLNKDDLKYSIQEFDNSVLDLVNQKRLYPYEYMTDFENFKEKLLSKENFHSSLTNRKINGKEQEHVINYWKNFK